MSGKLNELIRKGEIKKEDYTQKLVGNELKEALYDANSGRSCRECKNIFQKSKRVLGEGGEK